MAKQPLPNDKRSGNPEAKGLLLLGASLIVMLSLFSFKMHESSNHLLGLVGYGIGFAFNYFFGLTSYLVVLYAGWMGWKLLCEQKIGGATLKNFYFSLFIISVSLLLNVIAEMGIAPPKLLSAKLYTESISLDLPYPHHYIRYNLGGVPSYFFYRDLPTLNLQRMLSDIGILITFSITAAVSFLLLTNTKIAPLVLSLKKAPLLAKTLANKWNTTPIEEKEELESSQTKSYEEIESSLSKKLPTPIYSPSFSEKFVRPQVGPKNPIETKINSFQEPKKEETSGTKKEKALASQRVYNGDFAQYRLPPLSLLSNPKKVDHPSLKKELRKQAEILEETLLSFGIEAKVGEIHSGPTITSFEVHPSIGVKVQKITALENDIALNLQAKSIRIIAPIPGKAAVGIETPSLYPQEVSFKEMLINYQQGNRKLQIPVILGKTVTGENVISDLAKMPHCIIAGATGSGKSVCINTLIMSILMNARPDEIKLIMIDPKKVELTPYTALPHMIAPVITEAHGAYAALSWLVKEMQVRYEILKQLGLRNITAFNNRVPNKELEGSLSTPVPERMYAIVAIIDEFADLMMVSSTDLETPIARIAQMARAVGIHLVLATQRPSREVITGLIKANFPTRIAFKVASRVNSQIILDENGADSLLGNGDMLFLPPGSSHLVRAQGAYISDEEINRIVSFISDQAPANYLISSFDHMKKEDLAMNEGLEDAPKDSLYDQAHAIVVETQTASTTYLQRKLKIGYARAASLMDELEAKGVIGPQEGSKPRRVFSSSSIPTKEEPQTEE